MPRLTKIAFAGVALATLAVASTLAAQQAAAPAITAPEIEFTQWKLANGLTVIALPDPTTITVTTSMWYQVGAAACCAARVDATASVASATPANASFVSLGILASIIRWR